MRRYLILFVAACALWTSGAREGAAQQAPHGSAAIATSSTAAATRPASSHGQAPSAARLEVKLPLKEKSVRFAIIRDTGTPRPHPHENPPPIKAFLPKTQTHL